MQADRNADILHHIENYCIEIFGTVARFGKDGEVFARDSVYRNAVALCVLQIGELTTNLTEDFKQTYRGMPWNKIKALRNVVAHNYGKIDAETLWETVEHDIPELQKYCEETLQQLNASYEQTVTQGFEQTFC